MISSLELARLCGVSQGTVDRALHGRPGIAESTRVKVLEAAKLHGYAPNPAARELMTGKSSTCGAVVPAGAGIFFMDLFEELRKALRKRGLSLLLAPAADEADCDAALNEMASRRVRGAAIVSHSDSYRIPKGAADSCRIVALVNPCEGAPYLAPDEERTGRDAAESLWSLGHRRIVHATYARRTSAIAKRREGYERFMAERGAAAKTLVQPSEEELLKAVREDGATALLCHNDWLALNCMRTLEKAGLKVPEEVSITGVDDSPTFNALFPGLSTMAYPYASIAEEAAAFMAGEKEELSPVEPAVPRLRATSAPPKG